MTYQNINQYVFSKVFLKPAIEISDISLTSDEKDFNEEVVFSTDVIGANDGNVLPININLDFSGSAQPLDITYYGPYPYNNILISKNYYNLENYSRSFLESSCFSSETICDIGLTGIDNGLISGMTGNSISYTMGLLTGNSMFDRYSYDRRFKMFQVRSFVRELGSYFSGITAATDYGVVSFDENPYGRYHELYGSFYQGFYKLFGYDYEVLPTRYHKGWTVEMLLRPRVSNDYLPTVGETTLNEYYPSNKNIFFYMGARAEDKFYHPADYVLTGTSSGYTPVTQTSKDLETCACSNTAVTNSDCITVYPETGQTNVHKINYFEKPKVSCETVTDPIHNPLDDSMSNALAVMFSGNPLNPNVCVRVLKLTGDCVTSGSCFDTGQTYSSGYTIQTYCSTSRIYDSCTGTTWIEYPHWVQLNVSFERNMYLDECDLYWRGGIGNLTHSAYTASMASNSVSLVRPPVTHDNLPEEQIEIVALDREWIDELYYRLGKLTIYINGKKFFVIDNFEEVIPRPFNDRKERQVGVPFNISWGGGTQGLHENLVLSALTTGNTFTYQQDPQLFPDYILDQTSLSGLNTNILIEQYFAGSFEGAVSQFRMYSKPLSVPEVQHNFRILKNNFGLLDLFCGNCDYTPTTLYLSTEDDNILTTESGDQIYTNII
jgi:hypothetical protein